MKKYALETTVGLFCLLCLLCVAYLTVKLGKMEILGGDAYRIKARFTSVAGLKPGSFVDMAGVQVGQVESIALDTSSYVAMVTLKINKDVPIDEDAIATIKTSGLIGDRYIAISPGGSDRMLKDGDVLVETEPAVDIEALISKYVFGSMDKKKDSEEDKP
ncbi:MAG: outer membrane lipid asymmetry maintenance protein MlaD [Thermodesulfobacteriota bacterium]